MLRKYNINGAMYEYDLDRPSVRDAMMLKTATGMNMTPFTQAFNDADPAVFQAFAWLLLKRAGVKGTDGYEQDDEEPDDAADPTTDSFSPSGITPDSTSPEPSTSMD